ncbi:MAG: AAA family ATPase [Bacteroidota bacterium]
MWKIANTQKWEDLHQQFDWIRDMKGVPQNSVYHAEGDVAIHTKMVMEALIKLPEYQKLDEQAQQVLFATALLHDVEKRSCTKIETDGSITSKGHAKKGAHTTKTLLYKSIKTPFKIRERIVKLVRHHGLPFWVFEKPDPVKALLQASLEVNLAHLAIFAKADMLGRICADQAEMLYKIELFKAFCEEQNCYGQSYPFPSNSARFTYFQKVDSSPNYVPFDDTKCTVNMLCGLPGVGKDTFIQQHYQDWEVVSLDAIRRAHKIDPKNTKANGKVLQLAKEKMKALLRKHQSFVFNATNIIRQLRSQWIDLFTTYNAKVKIVYLEVPYAKLLQQNSNREYVVPSRVMEKMIRKLEIPTKSEAHEVDYFITEN